MKIHRFFSILSIAMLSNVCFAQTVSNVRFEQVDNKVKITYSLDKQADISVCVSADGGKTWSSPLKQVSGDVGKNIQAGAKTIWWDALSEYDQLVGTNICFKLLSQNSKNLTFTVNSVSFTMVYVQGGTFTMGATAEQKRDAYRNEKYAHKVTLSSYYIGEYEVTQGLWETVMGNNPALFQKGNSYPVECVSWEDCQQFINRLNSLLSAQLNGKRFALPTEAQWEYAACGGRKSHQYKYAGSNDLSNVAWYDNNSNRTTHPVGQKASNKLKLYDMSGNVEEWCSDWFGGYYNSNHQNNPISSYYGTQRIIRGGSWAHEARGCRVSTRFYSKPTEQLGNLGFRLVLLP